MSSGSTCGSAVASGSLQVPVRMSFGPCCKLTGGFQCDGTLALQRFINSCQVLSSRDPSPRRLSGKGDVGFPTLASQLQPQSRIPSETMPIFLWETMDFADDESGSVQEVDYGGPMS